MSLESLLGPAKWIDEQVLRRYTKVGRRFKLDYGRMKYFVGLSLWSIHSAFSIVAGYQVIGDAEQLVRIISNIPDFSYNINGAIGIFKDEIISETRTKDPVKYIYQQINLIERLPILAAGVGLVGKSGINLFNYILNGEPVDSNNYDCLTYGVGLLSLASSMYIKEMDPKLLQKQPSKVKAFFKGLYEKAKGLVPSPNPTPEPAIAGAFSGLEDYALAPQLIPQPVPLQSSAGLEDYVKI